MTPSQRNGMQCLSGLYRAKVQVKRLKTYGDVFGILISTFNCFILLQNGKTFYSTSFFTKRNIHSYDIFRCHAVDHQIMDHDVLV